jgi:CHAD domain-containing protein
VPPTALSDLDATASVAEWLPAVLTASATKLRANVDRDDLDDVEAVHDQRVATRRLRSHLRTFEPLLDEAWAEDLRSELKWLAGEIGRVRDPDVLLAWLDDRAPGSVHRAELAARRDEAAAALRATLGGARAARLLGAVADAAAAPAFAAGLDATGPACDAAVPLVARTWRRLRKAVREIPGDPADDRLHQVRIRTKRCRYAAEAVEPLVGEPAGESAGALARVQDVLGDHQDTVVAEAVLHASPDLVALLRQERHALREQWPPAWHAAATPLERWLG